MTKTNLIVNLSTPVVCIVQYFKIGPFAASFTVFLSLQIQLMANKKNSMTGFKPRISRIAP